MQTITITTSQNIDIDYEIAGLGERIVAYIIDYALFVLIWILILISISFAKMSESTVGYIIAIIVYAALFVFYDLICEIFMNGQSIGKRVMKIKVISLDGARPSVSQYLLRWLFRLVDFPMTMWMCGLITAAVSENNQRVGDIVAGTTLIKTHPRTQMSSIAFMPAYDGYQPLFSSAGQLSDKDIELMHEVINNYIKTGNNVLVYNLAARVKEHLGVTPPNGMNDMLFLQTVIKDYSHISAQADML